MSKAQQVTASVLLEELQRGDPTAADRLFPLVYDELRRIARGLLRGERPAHTLQPTALVHEAYLRLVDQRNCDPKDRRHFVAVAYRQLGNDQGVAGVLNNLGVVADMDGNSQEAEHLFQQALELNRRLGNRGWEALNLGNLAIAARRMGDYRRSYELSRDSLRLKQRLGQRRSAIDSLWDIALAAIEIGHPQRAALLAGAAGRPTDDKVIPLDPAFHEDRANAFARLQRVLGEEALEAALAEGRALSLEQAVELALAEESVGARRPVE